MEVQEWCIACCAATGKAGKDEDSLYFEFDGNTLGPLCEDCFDYFEQLQAELNKSVTENPDVQRLISQTVKLQVHLVEKEKEVGRVQADNKKLLSIMRSINRRAKNSAPMEDFIHLSEQALKEPQ